MKFCTLAVTLVFFQAITAVLGAPLVSDRSVVVDATAAETKVASDVGAGVILARERDLVKVGWGPDGYPVTEVTQPQDLEEKRQNGNEGYSWRRWNGNSAQTWKRWIGNEEQAWKRWIGNQEQAWKRWTGNQEQAWKRWNGSPAQAWKRWNGSPAQAWRRDSSSYEVGDNELEGQQSI